MNPNNTIDLAKFLLEFETTIDFIANPGNAGDSLIACATHQFLQNNGVKYQMHTEKEQSLANRVVMYAGGGNFGGINSRVAQYIQRYAYEAKAFILLPHTLFGAEELLADLPESVHIVCREEVSFEHASKHCKKAHVYLHDDMVINADVSAFLIRPEKDSVIPAMLSEMGRRLKGNSEYDFGIALNCTLRYFLYRFKTIFTAKSDSKILNAFRTDVEKTDIPIPADNIDISDTYELSSCDIDLAYLSTYKFLKHIEPYDVVRTNRLHIAIGAMKLGKKVELYGNNYFKIKAIYEYSIKGRFDNVIWKE